MTNHNYQELTTDELRSRIETLGNAVADYVANGGSTVGPYVKRFDVELALLQRIIRHREADASAVDNLDYLEPHDCDRVRGI